MSRGNKPALVVSLYENSCRDVQYGLLNEVTPRLSLEPDVDNTIECVLNRKVKMPFCETVLLIPNSEDVEPILSLFAKENFVQGQAAYHLGNGRYAVDAGENDLRAIFDEDEHEVKFFCRYSEEIARYDERIRLFAQKYKIKVNDFGN